MHIGLIGGIGPAATDFYYRRLIAAYAELDTDLELTIVHADTPTLLKHLAANDQAAQTAIYQRLTKRLVQAGAECVVVTSIAGSFCITPFKAVSPLPVIDIIEAVNAHIVERGLKRVGILGTRTVMESRFYGSIQSAEVIPPAGDLLAATHDAYVAMAASGEATAAQRQVFAQASRHLLQDFGAEAIMLGGTDLALVYSHGQAEFPLVDCAAIHVDAIINAAAGANPG